MTRKRISCVAIGRLRRTSAQRFILWQTVSRSRRRKEWEVFGWSRIPNNTGSRSRIFCQILDVKLVHFLHHSPKLGIPVEMVQFISFETCVETEISFCPARFPLILAAKFHSLYSEESENLERSESEILEMSEI